jgi:hypothetical protein
MLAPIHLFAMEPLNMLALTHSLRLRQACNIAIDQPVNNLLNIYRSMQLLFLEGKSI